MNEEDKLNKSHITVNNVETMKSFIGNQISLLESFLNEFCEINGIKEAELKNYLRVMTSYLDNMMQIIDTNTGSTKFGVRIAIKYEGGKFIPYFEVFGEYADHKEDYPKTTALIESLKL